MKVLLAALLLAVTFSAQARNPGESASSCVKAEVDNKGEVTFSNRCGEKVFVLYCGELKYSKDRCGDGPKGGFYTHSKNLQPGAEATTHVKGRFRYAACKGGISFGNDGEYEDSPNGQYRCLKR